ncbi:MAG: metallophosphoesterase [Saprospiraceae bacterium]|nr:metallophosphoesterase [Lewinella sp.]
MRLLILLAVLLGIDLYVFQAIRFLASDWSATTRSVVFGLYWTIPIILIGTLVMVSSGQQIDWNKPLFNFLRAFLFIAYLSKFVIGAVLLIDDVRRLLFTGYQSIAGTGTAGNISRSRFLTQFGVLLGSIPFVSLTYGIIRNPYRYKLFAKKINIPNLPEALKGLKIIQISDIHSGSFTLKEPIKRAIEMINEQQPDLVFFTGDLVNNEAREMEPFIDVFDKIEARHGVYSVLGNHDYGDYVRWDSLEAKHHNMQRLFATHRQLGWDLLRNEHRLLDINGHQVAVLGVENYSAHPRFPKYGDLTAAYQGAEHASLKLLLSHDPTHWEDQVIKDFQDVAITFSGHTHGMQFGVEIPGWFKWSPIQYIYKQWAGLYQRQDQYLYVNRGFGFLGYPGRVGILPEITMLELV